MIIEKQENQLVYFIINVFRSLLADSSDIFVNNGEINLQWNILIDFLVSQYFPLDKLIYIYVHILYTLSTEFGLFLLSISIEFIGISLRP